MTHRTDLKTMLLLIVTVASLLFFTTSPLVGAAEKNLRLGFLVSISGLGDQSYNDMAYAGLVKARQDYEFQLLFEDSKKTDTALDASMKRLLDKGATIIVANGFYMKDLVRKYALLYPARYFILQDTILADLPNVASILYSVHEGSFLVGALAGLMTESGHVGFIGGVDIPIMHVFSLGFTKGVEHTNPTAKVQEEFVTVAPDFSGFTQPAKGYRMAHAAYENKVDIIFAAAGLTGNGVIQAARETGKFAIGVDADQDHLAKGSVLTSMMKRLDIATHQEVSEIIMGQFKPGVKRYGLKEKGVCLSPMKYSRHLIPEETLLRISEIEDAIVAGKIHVPDYLAQDTIGQQEAN